MDYTLSVKRARFMAENGGTMIVVGRRRYLGERGAMMRARNVSRGSWWFRKVGGEDVGKAGIEDGRWKR